MQTGEVLPLLDYIYGISDGKTGAAPVGGAIFGFTTNCQGPFAVRERRSLIANAIDRIAANTPNARILSIACGHLREAEISQALKLRSVAEFVAFDQDDASLAVVARDYPELNIQTMKGSVRSLVASESELIGIHFVYAAGLFDYLADRTAARLTRVMFNMLAPGGHLLVANFAMTLEDIGFMEAYMRWHLIYRDEAAMRRLASEIPTGRIARTNLFWDSRHCMLFLELERG